MENLDLTPNQKQRILNIEMLAGSVALIGSIGGLIYAKNTGGGFLRYVGYWIVGGLITGIPARLVATPFKNKILKEGDGKSVKTMATKSDGLQVINKMKERDKIDYTQNQINYFSELYSQNIDEKLHGRILEILSRNEITWSKQDKDDIQFLFDKVIKYLK
jgi:hypothetical protein